MDIAAIVLNYISVFLSVQVIAGVVALVSLFLFKEDIRAVLKRIARLKLPGGSEVSLQAEKPIEDSSKKESPQLEAAEKVPIPEKLSLTPEQVEGIKEIISAEQAHALLWEYRYLNYFLVLRTQMVLNWLASLTTRTTVAMYDSSIIPKVPLAEERNAIIEALQAHHLITVDAGLIEVTPKGRDYIRWRGPLPEKKVT